MNCKKIRKNTVYKNLEPQDKNDFLMLLPSKEYTEKHKIINVQTFVAEKLGTTYGD